MWPLLFFGKHLDSVAEIIGTVLSCNRFQQTLARNPYLGLQNYLSHWALGDAGCFFAGHLGGIGSIREACNGCSRTRHCGFCVGRRAHAAGIFLF